MSIDSDSVDTNISDSTDKNIGILDPDGKNNNPLNSAEYSDNYRELAKKWSELPAYSKSDEIIQTIRDSQVTLVVSGTGSGKTVLVPKFALHALGYDKKIAITLPKKMIAKSAAEYAAATLDVKVGEHVGYQYRGSSSHSEDTRLLYCTDGTLVSRLMTDPELKDFDCAIIDEAHERKVNIDLLLYLLKNVVKSRPEFRLIIMSATINREVFERYYSDITVLEVSGKPNYPIESIYLDEPLKDDYIKKGVDVIRRIVNEDDSGDTVGILFFVTSVGETVQTCKTLDSINDQRCISVYSGMSDDESKMATDQTYYLENNKTRFKILISTNVAESSLTVEGIKYVIDSGLELKSSYDHKNKIHKLLKQHITQSQVKQRMGRTGRTGPGVCYHLYTKTEYDDMLVYPDPAIKTEELTIDVLRILNFDTVKETKVLKETLGDFIEPPPSDVVEHIIHDLTAQEMIEHDEITPLGKLCVAMQLEPRHVRSLVMGYRLHCFKEILAIVCLGEEIDYSIQSLFVPPKKPTPDMTSLEKKKLEHAEHNRVQSIKKEYSNMYGDHLALLKIFGEYNKIRADSDAVMKLDKMYLKKRTLDFAYREYRRQRHRLFELLKEAAAAEPDMFDTKIEFKDIMAEAMNIRVLACLYYGLDKVKTNGKTANIQIDNVTKTANIDRDSFVQKKTKPKKAMYEILFQFDLNRPVKAKMITYASEKSVKLIDKL